MSFEAMRDAMKQSIKKSSVKFVLLAVANYADKDTRLAYPSIATLADDTSQDRKTVVAALRWLVDGNYLTDTGERVGRTKQVIVYRFNTKGDQERNGSENGTVPNLPCNSTVFPLEQSRFSSETVPKTVHGTSKEPINEPVIQLVSERARTSARDPASKGTRVQRDFTPSDEDMRLVASECPGVDLKCATSEFVDYWLGVPGAKGLKSNWNATWRNSIRRAYQFQRRVSKAPTRPPIAQQFGTKTYSGTPDDELPDFLRTTIA